jgi:tripartite-type tricarboxylate transporter receptor subunit TctC
MSGQPALIGEAVSMSMPGPAVWTFVLTCWIGLLGMPLAHAETDYPSRLVKIIVPTAAGGATDLTARSAGRALTEALGQSFVVENRPGAHGLLAANAVLKEKHDGYTLLMMASSQSALPALYEMPYEPVDDFSPIALLSIAPVVLVVNASLPVTSVQELVRYAKGQPRDITYGYQSNTTSLSCALLSKLAGIEAVAVPFAASAQVATELIAGRLTFTLMTTEQAKVHVDAGRLRALATAGSKRAAAFPDIPTLTDLGYPVDGTGWFGLVGPSALPTPVVDKLYLTLKRHYIGKAGQAAIVAAGLEAADEGPMEFTTRLKSEIALWIQIGTELGVPKGKL